MENWIKNHITPINGQWPRPWMDVDFPIEEAEVFLAGCNPAKTFPSGKVTQEQMHYALLRRNDWSVRRIYCELNYGSPSRSKIDEFCAKLTARGITKVLQTNVICYSTKKSTELSSSGTRDFRDAGGTVFESLLTKIRPSVLVVHGGSAFEQLKHAGFRGCGMERATSADKFSPRLTIVEHAIFGRLPVISMGPLALPGFNQWIGDFDCSAAKITEMILSLRSKTISWENQIAR